MGMTPRHKVSKAAVELIKTFEGYRSKAAQLPDGRWTIGFGHTLTAREGAQVSEQDAEALLLYDLIAIAHAVNEQTFTPLTQNQFDALCCFAFNIGVDNFRRSSVLPNTSSAPPRRNFSFASQPIAVSIQAPYSLFFNCPVAGSRLASSGGARLKARRGVPSNCDRKRAMNAGSE